MFRKKIPNITIIAFLFIQIISFANALQVTYDPSEIPELFVDDELNVTVSIHIVDVPELETEEDSVSVKAEPESILGASLFPDWNCINFVCNATVKLTGRFLGFGKLFVLYKNSSWSRKENSSYWDPLQPPLNVTVLRRETIANKLFSIFVSAVVTINYINFGCALEIDVVKKVLKRPIGPAVGFACQFIVMPLVSYGVGYALFSDTILRFGLFTFGSSPGGGASNMWTVLLGGNLNLSITMTFISTLAAFGTLPLWLFTLGRTIIKDTNIVVPYTNIITSLVSFVVPIIIGILLQRFFPKIAARSKKYLAPICIILVIGIVSLAAVVNTYIFKMMTWKVAFAASLSVWTGFLAGILVSVAFRFPKEDMIAVAVETGIQSSGIAFVLLNYSLHKPVSEIAAVVPVTASMITPIPLFIVFCSIKIRNCCFRSESLDLQTVKSEKDVYQLSSKSIDVINENANELKDNYVS